MYTLEYNSVEKSLDDWGISGPRRNALNQGFDHFAFDIDGDFLAADPFPYGAKIIFRIGRALAGAAWSGGSIDYIGYRVDHFRAADASMERFQYKFESAWGFFFELLTFQQSYQSWNNSTHANETLTRSQICLGQAADGNRQGLRAQIQEIVNWVINQTTTEYGSPQIQLGDSYPDGWIPYDAINNITCGEALKRCLRWIGGGANSVWIDYDTTPPTLHCKSRADLTAVNLAVLGEPERVNITRRDDLVPSAVCLKYRVAIQDGGLRYVKICEDIASEHGAGHTDLTGAFTGTSTITQLRADALRFGSVVQTFDFEGPTLNQVAGTLATVAFAPTSLDFWRAFCPELSQFTYLALVQQADSSWYSLDQALADSSLVYAVTGGTVSGFMGNPAKVQKLNISAYLSGTVKTGDNRQAQIVQAQLKSVQVTLTNVPGGTYLKAIDYGEIIPWGLAAQIYAAETPAPYQGTHVLGENDYTARIGIGNVLNLTGGLDEWTSMRAQVQSIDIDYTDARTTVTLGPATHLGAGDLIDRLRAERGARSSYYIGCNRNNDPNSQVIELGTPAAPNSTSGHTIPSYQAGFETFIAGTGANYGTYWFDAANREIGIKGMQYVSEGMPGDGKAAINLNHIPTPVASVGGTPSTNPEQRKRAIYLREIPYYDNDGKKYFQIALASEHYGPGTDGSIAGSGTGATQELTITAVDNDYVTCSSGSTTGILVAKPREARKSLTTETKNGVTYTYSTPSGATGLNAQNTRISTGGGFSEYDVILPPYQVGDIIYPQAVDHTGVTVASVELKLIEPAGSRLWAWENPQPE